MTLDLFALAAPAATPIKAISLWQPWASLWLTPYKIHETRHWSTAHRGLLAVHAAKRIVADVDGDVAVICEAAFGPDWARTLPGGAVIGAVDLIGCFRTEDIATGQDDLACGDFSDGRFGWKRGAMHTLERPIPYRGLQSMFILAPHVGDALRGIIA